jgi:hypothetical protein
MRKLAEVHVIDAGERDPASVAREILMAAERREGN